MEEFKFKFRQNYFSRDFHLKGDCELIFTNPVEWIKESLTKAKIYPRGTYDPFDKPNVLMVTLVENRLFRNPGKDTVTFTAVTDHRTKVTSEDNDIDKKLFESIDVFIGDVFYPTSNKAIFSFDLVLKFDSPILDLLDRQYFK
jgi:hypothetical protein